MLERKMHHLIIIDDKMSIKNIKSNEELIFSNFEELLNFLKSQ